MTKSLKIGNSLYQLCNNYTEKKRLTFCKKFIIHNHETEYQKKKSILRAKP